MKVICLAFLAVGSRSVGVGQDISSVVRLFMNELQMLKEAQKTHEETCRQEKNEFTAAMNAAENAMERQKTLSQRAADAAKAAQSKADSLGEEIEKATVALEQEVPGPDYDPTKCNDENTEYNTLIGNVESALASIQASAEEVVGGGTNSGENQDVSSCMASCGGPAGTPTCAEQATCDAAVATTKDKETCENETGCMWAVQYSYSGASVVQVLKNLKDQFEDELKTHTLECQRMENAHNLAEQAKAERTTALNDSITEMTLQQQEAEAKVSTENGAKTTADGELETQTGLRNQAESSLQTSTAQCANTEKTQSEQKEALEEVIRLMQDLEAGKVSEPTLFLQVGHFIRRLSPGQRVKEHLERFAKNHPHANFAALVSHLSQAITTQAGGVKKGAFTKVIGLIQELVARLNKQKQDENKEYEHCLREYTSNMQSYSDTSTKMAAADAEMGELTLAISENKIALGETKQDIKDAKQLVKETNDTYRATVKAAKLQQMDAKKCIETCNSADRILKHHFGKTDAVRGADAKDTRLSTLLGSVDGLRTTCVSSRDGGAADEENAETTHAQFTTDKENEIKNLNAQLKRQQTIAADKKQSHTAEKKKYAMLQKEANTLDRFYFTLSKQCFPESMQTETKEELTRTDASNPGLQWESVKLKYEERKEDLQNEIDALNTAVEQLEEANH